MNKISWNFFLAAMWAILFVFGCFRAANGESFFTSNLTAGCACFLVVFEFFMMGVRDHMEG